MTILTLLTLSVHPLLLSCNTPTNPQSESPEQMSTSTISLEGKVMTPCDGIAMIDVMDFTASENEPVFFTQVEKDGSFTVQIPSTGVSQIHGFCYASVEALDAQNPTWKMIPKQIHAAQAPDFLALNRLEKEPPKAQTSQIENRNYLRVEEDRQVQEFFEEFYGQRLSEKQAQEDGIMMGSYPSRNYSHLSTRAFYQYIDALYALVKQHSGITQQAFLLPNETEWKQAKQEQEIYGPKTLSLLYQLQSACVALTIPCPSWRMVRSEELSILDKTILSLDNTRTKTAALLWITADRMAKEAIKQRLDPLPYLPHPLEISIAVRNGATSPEWAEMRTKLQSGYAAVGLNFPEDIP